MTKLHEDFEDILDVDTKQPVKKKAAVGGFTVPPVIKEKATDLDEDFEFARTQIKDLSLEGMQALNKLIQIIEDNDETKSGLFDSVSTMINAMTNTQKALMELHEKKANTNKKNVTTEKAGEPNKVENHFHGTTADLQEALKELREEGKKRKA
jgi:hypothetical protein